MILGLIILFFVLIFLGAPIAIAMGMSSVTWLFLKQGLPSVVMAQKMFTATDSFSLMAIPFFMLAGQLMERTGITEDIVVFSRSVVGHIRGGLAHTTVLSGMLMAGVSGSANADASAIGALMLPALRKNGYGPGFSVSVVAASAGLGPIIPPSVIMIVYASVAGMEVGSLFMSGVLPGILLGCGYMIISYLYARKIHMERSKFAGFRNIGRSFIKAVWALIMPVIILGGLLSGVCTATEAGVIAVVYGLIYGLVRHKLDVRSIIDCLQQSVIATAGPMLIIAVSSIFGYMLSYENVTTAVSDFCQAHIGSQFGFFMFTLLICLIAGCFIDSSATLLMMTPILLPVAISMGIHALQFACFFVIALLTAGLTPPVGMLLFIVSGINQTPIRECVKAIWPFVSMMIFLLIMIALVPGITLFIPSLFG